MLDPEQKTFQLELLMSEYLGMVKIKLSSSFLEQSPSFRREERIRKPDRNPGKVRLLVIISDTI